MAIDYDHLMSLRARDERFSYTDRDTMLYALAVGMGRDPLDQNELAYVYEGSGLRTVPTMASAVAWSGLLEDCGWDFSRVLHGEERLTLHQPLPDAGTLLLDSKVTAVHDKGPDKGAVIYTESQARRENDGGAVFTLGRTIIARADGGFGGSPGSGRQAHPIPKGEPDLSCTLRTRSDQALVYRLCGDRNPLHANPALARRLGFPVPILHGLCTSGIACRAILKTICEYDHTLINEFDVRFSAPVFPGETIVTEMWQEANIISFRVRVQERDLIVLNHGRCVLTT